VNGKSGQQQQQMPYSLNCRKRAYSEKKKTSFSNSITGERRKNLRLETIIQKYSKISPRIALLAKAQLGTSCFG
jgi:hypothetical protein